MKKSTHSHYLDIGVLGEDLIANWLKSQGQTILQQRWRSRYGEIDLISQFQQSLSFIEVKTRKGHNLDEDGKLTINSKKQAKIFQTAELFLAQYPEFADFHCRFDVAIIKYKVMLQNSPEPIYSQDQRSLCIGKYQLYISEYITSAF
jgi:putative endonuclease